MSDPSQSQTSQATLPPAKGVTIRFTGDHQTVIIAQQSSQRDVAQIVELAEHEAKMIRDWLNNNI